MNTNTLGRRTFYLQIFYVFTFLFSLGNAKDVEYSGREYFQFRTRPDIVAPRWTVTRHRGADAAQTDTSGYWFTSPYKNVAGTDRGQPWVAPLIYDQAGELVWSGAPLLDHYRSFDFRVSTVQGEDMLTVIYPQENGALILDSAYQLVRRVVHSDVPESTNMHEFNVVEDGTRALVLTKREANLTLQQLDAVGFHGDCSVRADGLKYLDISGGRTKELLVWRGEDHIGVDESDRAFANTSRLCSGGGDVFNFNSLDVFPDGDILLSSGYTSTLYKVSSKDGSIVWRIGGHKSTFQLGPRAKFSYQHHGRVLSQNGTHTVISVFDNTKDAPDGAATTRGHSSGLVILLDTQKMTGELISEYPRPVNHIAYTWKQGSTQVLENGNVFMGWSESNLISEHRADGEILIEAEMIANLETYRSFKFQWVGRPKSQPAVYSAAFTAGSDTSTTVYVSWNGATEVAHWRLCEADELGDCNKVLLTHPRTGFETEMIFHEYVDIVVVQALDVHQKVLRTSRLTRTIPPVQQEMLPFDHDLSSHTIVSSANQSHQSYPQMGAATNESYKSYFHPVTSETQGSFGSASSRTPRRLLIFAAFASGLVCGYAARHWKRIIQVMMSWGSWSHATTEYIPLSQRSESRRVSTEMKQ